MWGTPQAVGVAPDLGSSRPCICAYRVVLHLSCPSVRSGQTCRTISVQILEKQQTWSFEAVLLLQLASCFICTGLVGDMSPDMTIILSSALCYRWENVNLTSFLHSWVDHE